MEQQRVRHNRATFTFTSDENVFSLHKGGFICLLHCLNPYGRKWRTKEPLDESERREWKSWLKGQHSEDCGIWPHYLVANRWRNSGNSGWLFILGSSKITADGDCSHEIKRCLFLGRKVMTKLDRMLKAEALLCQQSLSSQGCGFSSVMYGCESWVLSSKKLSTEELMLLNCGVGEDSWESLSLQGDPTSPSWRKSVLNVHWKDWSWNSNTLATWWEELTHLKRPWCWERLRAEGEGDDRGWDDWMASLTQWTWVWVNSGSWWWQGGLACYSPWGCKEPYTTAWLK